MSARPALSRPLDLEELRVLGTLIEKSTTTPDQYPLSVNATRVGCNQKTARDPVVDFDERTTYAALGRLRALDLVRERSPADSRVARYEHQLGLKLDIRNGAVAVLGVLMLRGPQTAGELRQHSHRMHEFDSIEAVEDLLDRLQQRDPALVVKLPRGPGQREDRWLHLLGTAVAADYAVAPMTGTTFGVPVHAAPVPVSAPGLDVIARLEQALAELQTRVAQLEARLGTPDEDSRA